MKRQSATDEQILAMLKEDKSYSDIQAELRVSPSRIIVVKKVYEKSLSSTNSTLLGTTIEKNNTPPTTQNITPTPPPTTHPEIDQKTVDKQKEIEKLKRENRELEQENKRRLAELDHLKSSMNTQMKKLKSEPVLKNNEKNYLDGFKADGGLKQVSSGLKEQIENKFKNIDRNIHPEYGLYSCANCGIVFKKPLTIYTFKLQGKDILFCSKKCVNDWSAKK